MTKLLIVPVVAVLALLVAVPASAAPGEPDFGAAIYADGEAFGTKVVTTLPAPDGNDQSFDELFVFTNAPEDQLPVAEAAPGPGYDGGRWITWTVTWHVDPPQAPLTSNAQVMAAVEAGHLTIEQGSPEGGPPDYFLCPLLPVKAA